MRLPWISWDKTLRRLGFVRRKIRRTREGFRRPQVEALETRDLLTTVSVMALPSSVTEGGSPGTFTFSQSGNPPVGFVDFTLSGNATLSSDFNWGATLISGNTYRATFTGTTAMVSVSPIADGITEGTESVSVQIVSGSGYTPQSPSSATIQINDGSGGGGGGGGQSVSVTAQDSAASETGPDPGKFRITRNGTGPLSVNFNLTGTAGSSDYTSSHSGHVDFGSSDTFVEVDITPENDSIYESTETVILTITSGSGYTGSGSATVNIADNDPQPSITINDWTGPESSNAVFTVQLSNPSASPITVHYATQNGTAVGGNGSTGDYTSIGDLVLTFNPGDTSKPVTVTVRNDTDDEANEDFFVNLSGASGATIGDSQGKGTIQDNDAPNIWVDDAQITEGGQLSFGVHLSYANSQTTRVSYSTAPWTADSNDYSGVTGTLTFNGNSGVTYQTVLVPTTQDTLDENDEVLNLQLDSPENGQITDGQADGTILDNDPLPTVSITTTSVNVNESANAQFTVVLSPASGRTVTVNYSTTNGTAVAPGDFTAPTGGSLTFTPGQTTQTISVPTFNDSIDEDNETFTVNLSGATNATIGTSQGTATILDDDLPPTISVADAMSAEGGNMTFTLSLSSESGKTISVDYATSEIPNSADDPLDYSGVQGTKTFSPGTTQVTVTVPIISDENDETDETFWLNLSNLVNVTPGDVVAVGTIDDDDGPTITINNVTVNEQEGPAVFTIGLSTASLQEVRVHWQTYEQSAKSGIDFTASSGTAIIPAGQLSVPISVPIINDIRDEYDETFQVKLTNPVDGKLGTQPGADTGTGTIQDDDPLPMVAIGNGFLEEQDGVMIFTVTLSPPSEKTVTVQFGTSSLSATSNDDYSNTAGTITFEPFDTTENVYVTIKHDTADEIDEQFNVFLYTPVDAQIDEQHAVGVGTIDDNDGPSVSIAGITVPESVGSAQLTVTLSATSLQTVYVHYETLDGSAHHGTNQDYTATSGDLEFPPGTQSLPILVPIRDDLDDETDEVFSVVLSQVVDGTLSQASATVTIDDNDGPWITINNPRADEASGTITFNVHLSAPSQQVVTVHYQTEEQTADEGLDYLGIGGSISFSIGSQDRPITVELMDDFWDETDETFLVNLSGEVDGYFQSSSDRVGIGTIDDDDGPTVSIGDASLVEADAVMLFPVTLSTPSLQAVTVYYSTSNGTAFAPGDYTAVTGGTLTIPAGQTTGNIEISIKHDVTDEVDETFTVTLTAAVDATLGDAQGTGTILDNDEPPALTIDDPEVSEKSGPLVFTVTLTPASGKTVSVDFATANGTALAGSDYTAQSGTLTFAPGETSKPVSVVLNNDLIAEDDETLKVDLSNLVNATSTDTQGIGTILDNETRVKIVATDPQAAETADGSNQGTFTITRSGDYTGSTTVYYQVTGTATNGADYFPMNVNGFVTIMSGTTATLTVSPSNDSFWEVPETVIVTLQANANYSIDPVDFEDTVTIADNDHWTVKLETVVAHAYEIGQTDGQFKLVRSGETDLSHSLSVTYSVDPASTASQILDYQQLPYSPFVIPANETELLINIHPVSDSPDHLETVILKLVENNNYYELGAPSSGTVTIHDGALNDPPTINPISNITIDEDAPEYTVPLSGITAGFEETQVLTVTASTGSSALITNLGVDYTSDQTTGSLHFTPGHNEYGNGIISVVVADDGGASTTVSFTVTVNPVNDPPVAQPGEYNVNEDSYRQIILQGSDPDGDQIQYRLVSLPSAGMLAYSPGSPPITGTGLVTSPVLYYLPNPGFYGPDETSFAVDELIGGIVGLPSAPAPIHIDVIGVNDPPAISAPDELTVLEDTQLQFGAAPAVITISDPDAGDQKLLTKVTAAHGTLTVDNFPEVNGPFANVSTITVLASQTKTNEILATLRFQPDADYAGSDASITVLVNDQGHSGAGGPKTATKVIQIEIVDVNDPPINHLPVAPIFARICESTAIPGLSISDVDDATGHYLTILDVAPGTVSVNGGAGQAHLEIDNSLVATNGILGTLTYNPPLAAVAGQLATLTITTNDNGQSGEGGPKSDIDSFTIILTDKPEVKIEAPDPDAYEENLDPGQFKISRECCGTLAAALSVEYIVRVDIPKAAWPDLDYVHLTGAQWVVDPVTNQLVHRGTVDIPANSSFVYLNVIPKQDNLIEGDEYVRVDLVQPSATVSPGSPGGYDPPPYFVQSGYSSATVTIHDYYNIITYPEIVALSATDAFGAETAAAEISDDGEVTFTRGEQNIGQSTTIYFKINEPEEGVSSNSATTAVVDQDFTVVGASQTQDQSVWQVTIPSTKSSAVVRFVPINDSIIEWDETIRVKIVSENPNTQQPVNYSVAGSPSTIATLFDNDGFSGLQNRNLDRDSTSLGRDVVGNGQISVDVYEGQIAFGVSLPGAVGPAYQGDDNLFPLLPVDWQLPAVGVSGTAAPASIKAKTMFGMLEGPEVTFDVSAGVTPNANQLHYVTTTNSSISEQLATGHYDYNLRFEVTYAGDAEPRVRTIRGSTEIVNALDNIKGDTEFGKRWRLGELDQMVPDDGNTAQFTDQGLAAIGGQAVVRGDNTSGFFESSIKQRTVKSDPQFTNAQEWHDGTYASTQPYKYTASGDKAKWEFDTLVQNRQYQVFATWVPGLTRTPAANFKVLGTPIGSADSSRSIIVDQRYTPGEVLDGGIYWRSLGFYTADLIDNKIIIELTGSGGETVAQSVMLVGDWNFDKTPLGSFSQLVYEDSSAAGGEKRFIVKDKFGGKAEFNDQGLLQRREDRNHNETRYEYTDGDNDLLMDELQTITRQGGLETNFAYNSAGYFSTITDFAGRVVDYTMDNEGFLKSIKLPPATESDAENRPTWEFAHGGPNGAFDYVADPRTNPTNVQYGSGTHRVSAVTNADDYSWQITPYLVDGLPGGNAPSAGNAPIRKPATGLIGQNEIDAELPAGSLQEPRATYTDPRGNDWVYQTDAFGLTTALAKPATEEIETEDVWQWERRPDGLATKYSQPKGGGGEATLNYRLDTLYDQYDSKGNLLHVEYPDETTASWQYNAQFAVVTKFTDQLNRETVYELDSRGNVEYVKTMDGGSAARTLRTQYTAQPSGISSLPGGLPTEVTVAHGSTADAVTTKNEYFTSDSKVGLVQKVTYALGQPIATSVDYDYDTYRNLASTKNALQPATTSVYDDLNRLAKVNYPAPGTGSDPAPFATFKYNVMGQVKESQNVRGVVNKTKYDAMNRVEYVHAPGNGGSTESNQQEQISQNFYDESGHIIKVKYPKQSSAQSNPEATFEYDERGQQIKTTLPAPGVTLPAGMTATLANAPVTNYAYDTLGNLKSLSDPRNSAWKTTYDYDDLNRRFHTIEPATEDHAATNFYSLFDDVGRLTSTVSPGPSGSALTTTYAYDRFDRLTKKTPPADSAGRKAVEEFTYDLRNNVLTASVAGKVTETSYDKLDRPLEAKSPSPGGSLGRPVSKNVYNAIGQVTENQSLEEGHPEKTLKTTFEYDALGRVVKSTGSDPDAGGPLVALVTTNSYDPAGNVLNSTTIGGSQSRMVDTEYDNYGRSWRVRGTPVGLARTETISVFGAAGELTQTKERVDGSAWRTFDYVFDNLGRLFKTTGPAVGGSRPETYTVADEDGNVTAVRDALGRVTSFAYDVLSRLKQIVEPAVAGQAKTTDIHHNAAGLVSSVTDALQRTTGNLYDNVGNLLQTSLPALGGVTPLLQYTYDVLGNLTSQTDVQQNVTTYLRDGLGRVMQTLFSASRAGSTSSGGGGSQGQGGGGSEVYLVDDGDSTFSTMGSWTTHSSDPAGFQDDYRTAEPDMMPPEAQYVFSVAPGKRYLVMATWKTEAANTQNAQYAWLDGMTQEGAATISQRMVPDDWNEGDQDWEVLGTADVATTGSSNFTVKLQAGTSGTTVADAVRLVELGPAASSVYDGLGRVIAQTNELGQTTTYAYDLAGNQTLVTLPDPDGSGPLTSSFTASSYNSFGQLEAQWNAANETTLFGYNARGERISITDPTNQTTLLGYDLLGRNTSVTDPAGNVTTFQFDDLDRKIGETQHYFGGGSSTRSFGYDLAGNRTLAVDRNGRATVYAYDARDQLYSEAWFGSLADANASQNQLGGITYSYDLAGRMVQAGTYAFGYDLLDRLASETSSHIPGGVTLSTSYGDRLDSLRASVGATIAGAADFANQYSYDARLQLTQILQAGVSGGHTVAPKRVDFVHGANGRLDNITRYADLAGTQTAAQTNYAYDNQDRLTGINHFKASMTLAQYGFTYDTAGRINGFSSPDGTVSYAYNDRGELTVADYTGANQPADAIYDYDANGNRADAGFTIGGHNQPTTDASFVYTYDAEGNRTSRTSLTSGEYETYSWDNRNRLIQVSRRAANHTLLWTVDYAYDAQNRMLSRTQTLAGQSPSIELFVYDGNQAVLQTDAAGNVTHRYLWGESVDQILADESVDLVSGIGTTRWTLTDHLNTVRDLATYNSTTGTTSIVDHIIYDAFGKLASESSPANSTSLKFTGHYLDPLTGQQWNLNRWYDPGLHQWLSVDPILFEAGDPNPRRYVSNDPVNRVDPSGLAEGGNADDGTVKVSLSATELDLERIAHNSVTSGASGPLTSHQRALYESRLNILRRTISDLKAHNARIRREFEWQTRLVEYQGMQFEIPALQDYCEWTDELEQGLAGLSPRDRQDSLILQSWDYQQWGPVLDGMNDRILAGGIRRASAPLYAWNSFVRKAQVTGKLVGSATIFVSSFTISWTGYGAVIGVPGMLWSADQFQSAVGEIVTGEETNSIGHRLAVGAFGEDGGSVVGMVYDTVPGVVFACPELSMSFCRPTPSIPASLGRSVSASPSSRLFTSNPKTFGINLRPSGSGLDLASLKTATPISDALWVKTWQEAQIMSLRSSNVVEGSTCMYTNIGAARASGTPLASPRLLLPQQIEKFPVGACGMARSAGVVLEEGGVDILVTQGGFRLRNGQWYYVSPCRNCEAIFDLNPHLKQTPLPPGVPYGLPPNTQFPFVPPVGW